MKTDTLSISAPAELDRQSAAAWQSQVLRLLEKRSQRCEIDMSHTTMIDSGGMSVLLSVSHACVSRGQTLFIVNPTRHVKDMIAMTRQAFFGPKKNCSATDHIHDMTAMNSRHGL